MAGYGLVRLERAGRGRIAPKVTLDQVELDLPLNAEGGMNNGRLRSQSVEWRAWTVAVWTSAY